MRIERKSEFLLKNGLVSVPKTATLNLPKALFYLTFCVALIVLLAYQWLNNHSNYKLYYTLLKAVPAGDECEIPRPDPWDPSIKKYLENPKPLHCKKLQPELTYLNDDGWLIFNQSAAEEAGYSNLECTYQCFDRKPNTDDVTLEYGPWIPLQARVRPECQYVHVQCLRQMPSISIYTNLHNQLIVNHTRLHEINTSISTNERLERSRGRVPSVLIIVLDSVSHSNAVRTLPKTIKVLKELYGATVFDGLTKVGDNSFPNGVAMFLGKRVNTAGYKSELPDDMSKTFYDDWPFIWKDYHKAGYVTYHAEDYAPFNLFKYLAMGFQKQPTDHYFRPYWLQLWGSFLHRRSTHLCYGNNPSHRLQINYLRQFLTKYGKNQPKFMINWITELGHDWLNQVAHGDEDFAQLLEEMYPILSDSYVFVLGDHGHRFDAIRESVIGRIEERMPLFSVAVPKWLREQHEQLQQVIKRNSQILCSFFDFHSTLEDILRIQSEVWRPESQLNQSQLSGRRYSSLLRPLDPKRTCFQAGIPEDFCVCQQETMVNVTDSKVIRGAEILVGHVNGMLKDYLEDCARLQLRHIKNAQTFLPNLKMVMDPTVSIIYGGRNPSGFYINYRIQVEVEPSGALFEGTLRNTVKEDSFVVIGDVNRINKYGNQSTCVKTQLLRKYCYCILQ